MPCFAEEGIKLGSSTTLTVGDDRSPQQGLYVTEGINLYLQKINAAGGIKGQKVEFIVLDDNYNPVLAGENTHKLIKKDKVLAIIGNNGTPSLVVSIPIVNRDHILLYAATSGSSLLRQEPPNRYIINFRVGLTDITRGYIKGLLSAGIKPDEMAIITANDASGSGIYKEFIDALKKEGIENGEDIPYGHFDRNSVNIESAFAAILREARLRNYTTKVVILAVGGAQGSAKAFRLMNELIPGAIAYSFFDALEWMTVKDLVDEIYSKQIKIITVAPVPMLSSGLPAVNEYLDDIKKYTPDKKANLYALEGYLSAKLLAVALDKAAQKDDLNREGLIDAFESINDVDIGLGEKISLSKTNHQALQNGWPAIFKKDEFTPLQWSELKK